MTDRTAKRIAWAASAGLHLAAAVGVWRYAPPPTPAVADAGLHFTLVADDETVIQLELREPAKVEAVAVQSPPVATGGLSPPATPPTPEPPKPLPESVTQAPPVPPPVVSVVEVADVVPTPVPPAPGPATPSPPAPAPQPAAPAAPVGGGAGGGKTVAVHGELPTNKTAVYVLDCSGTMGLDGKLAAAVAAVRATLAAQPDGLRVQVVAYNGTAFPLLPGGPERLSPHVRERLANALRRLDPAGASRHDAGVKAAAVCRPDFVLLFTDADDEELQPAKPTMAAVKGNVWVCRVSAGRVGPPVGWK